MEFIGNTLDITLNSGSIVHGRVVSIDEKNQIIVLEEAIVNGKEVEKHQLLGNTIADIKITENKPRKMKKASSNASSFKSDRKSDKKPKKSIKHIKRREEQDYDIMSDPAIVDVNVKSTVSIKSKKWDPIEAYKEEFDFEENLRKFDKSKVFSEFKEKDVKSKSDLLVNLNLKKINHNEYIEPDFKMDLDELEEYDSLDDRPEDIDVEDRRLRHQFITKTQSILPSVTKQQTIQADLLLESECQGYFESSIEIAGLNLSAVLINYLGGPRRFSRTNRNLPPIAIFFVGHNKCGAISLCAARHLLNKGAQIFVYTFDAELAGLPDLLATNVVKCYQKQLKLFLYTSQSDNKPFNVHYSSLLTAQVGELPTPTKKTTDIIVDAYLLLI